MVLVLIEYSEMTMPLSLHLLFGTNLGCTKSYICIVSNLHIE